MILQCWAVLTIIIYLQVYQDGCICSCHDREPSSHHWVWHCSLPRPLQKYFLQVTPKPLVISIRLNMRLKSMCFWVPGNRWIPLVFSDTIAREMVACLIQGRLWTVVEGNKVVEHVSDPSTVIVSSWSPPMFSSEPAARERVVTWTLQWMFSWLCPWRL